jgi:hypothetical protein
MIITLKSIWEGPNNKLGVKKYELMCRFFLRRLFHSFIKPTMWAYTLEIFTYSKGIKVVVRTTLEIFFSCHILLSS